MDNFQPMRFGRRLWIVPSWHAAPEPDAVNLLLDPGLAFGTGTHPTTALCLEWLDGQELAGRHVLDFGCGSGILASAALLLGLFASLRCRLPVTEAEDLAPSLHWPAPLVDEEVDQERGPVMVTLEYDIDPQDAAAFQAAMVEVRAMRRRNGAVSWGLVQDSGNRRLWLEFFIDESWLEHLRPHQRVTRGELRVEAAVRRFQSAGVEVRIRHYLHGAARP